MSGTVDARTIQHLAREIWAGLTLAQQTALRRARGITGGFMLGGSVRKRTTDSLRAKLLVAKADSSFEPLGVLVRAEGLAVDASAARRRFNRRKVQA